ncbi:Uma2 family endonuclease [Leptolyngbya sp. CCNP1308]|uniref:Uma2 family endonuclease n=1 Tax=Leptolyngbya sp. CCNP1308 TaxID=3110255 RepID=UPI002B1EDB7C|nr:Uma2 family endonuclease [Leptolyngbya sp. CCNP1308]MEA5452710.1 Uma2 family endonuclease [Leptolyngbya sp. CCNP1308]
MTSTSVLLTFEDYLAQTDGLEGRYELVNGALVSMPPESPENLDIAKGLMFALARYIPISLIAYNTEIEVSGGRATCRLPDLVIHTEDSKAAIQGTTRATVTRDMPPPALVVEVVSPGEQNRIRDYRYKHTEYAARCIAEYWIVDPQQQQITVCQWVEGQYENAVFTGAQPVVSYVVPTFDLTAQQVLTLRQG